MQVSVKVTQVFKVERHVVFMVEADSLEAALEAVDAGDVDKPDLMDWVTGEWRLENEQVEKG